MGCIQSTAFTYCAQLPSPSDNDEPTGAVLLYNLAPTITVSQIRKEFQKFGELRPGRIRIVHKGATNSFGYVEFESESGARKAIQASPLMICGVGQRVSIEKTEPWSNSRKYKT